MVGIGFTIAEVITMITGGIVFGVFGDFMIAGVVMLLITAIWIGTLGTNGVGILVTGWLALLLYFSGAFMYSEILPPWIGYIVLFILMALFGFMLIKTIFGK